MFSARNTASVAMALMISVPLISASPSLAPSTTGASLSFLRPAAAVMRKPPTSHEPWPRYAAAMCAKGARSPEAPTEPCAGTTGAKPRLKNATSLSTSAGDTPERPRTKPFRRSTCAARTMPVGSGSPTPTQCDTTRFSCSCAKSSWAMATLFNLPKPVVRP